MTVLVRYSPASLDRATYDRVNEILRRRDLEPPRELELHVLFGDEPSLRVSELWASEEAWRRFQGPLREAFAEAGLEVSAPEILAVHAVWGSAVTQPA
jgi:hypothetical protein